MAISGENRRVTTELIDTVFLRLASMVRLRFQHKCERTAFGCKPRFYWAKTVFIEKATIYKSAT